MTRVSADVGQSIESLPAEQRIKRYRQFADAAFLEAQRAANPNQKAEYLSMATGWLAMAQELERTLDRALRGETKAPTTKPTSQN